MTTRPSAASCGSSRPVSRNGPKWLVASWLSKPSTVRRYGVAMMPALLTSRSIEPYAAASAAADRTDDRSARSTTSRSSAASGTSARIERLGLGELVGGAAGEHDASAGPGELQRRVVAEAARRSRR